MAATLSTLVDQAGSALKSRSQAMTNARQATPIFASWTKLYAIDKEAKRLEALNSGKRVTAEVVRGPKQFELKLDVLKVWTQISHKPSIKLLELGLALSASVHPSTAQTFETFVEALGTVDGNSVLHVHDEKLVSARSVRLICDISENTSRIGGLPEDQFIEAELVHAELHDSPRGPSSTRAIPSNLYRVHHENASTLSLFCLEAVHKKHFKERMAHLQPGNALQSIGKFGLNKSLVRRVIDQHLSWGQRQYPSVYISAFDKKNQALRRAYKHANTFKIPSHRVYIVEIRTSDLTPKYIRATLKEQLEITFKAPFNTMGVATSITRFSKVDIPVWISRQATSLSAMPGTKERQLPPDSEMFLCVKELRGSNLDIPASKAHDAEWLACGTILDTRVTRVMPYDGKDLHHADDSAPVRSLKSHEPWYWNWEKRQWRLSASQDQQSIVSRPEICAPQSCSSDQPSEDAAHSDRSTDTISPIIKKRPNAHVRHCMESQSKHRRVETAEGEEDEEEDQEAGSNESEIEEDEEGEEEGEEDDNGDKELDGKNDRADSAKSLASLDARDEKQAQGSERQDTRKITVERPIPETSRTRKLDDILDDMWDEF